MARKIVTTVALLVAFLALSGTAHARGGNYVFEGGSEEARAQVRAALGASSFNWNVVRRQVTIVIADCGCAGAEPGRIFLDESTLVSSPFGRRYAWGIVQHEYAHQVDFLLFSQAERRALRKQLGGADWCHERQGVGHDDHGCERFATALTWAYWRSPDNVQRPHWAGKKPAVAPFKRLVNRLVRQAAARPSHAAAPAGASGLALEHTALG
jgi:hypothetical protein